MTSEEIRTAIERLEALVRDNAPTVYDVAEVFACANGHGLRNVLIDLLKQVDSDTHVKLPVDANGEYIRVGDKLDGYGKVIEVVELRIGRSGWAIVSRDGNAYADTCAFTHHRKPTVEDVLKYVISEVVEYTGRHHRDHELVDAYIGEVSSVYAEKLRELMS